MRTGHNAEIAEVVILPCSVSPFASLRLASDSSASSLAR